MQRVGLPVLQGVSRQAELHRHLQVAQLPAHVSLCWGYCQLQVPLCRSAHSDMITHEDSCPCQVLPLDMQPYQLSG